MLRAWFPRLSSFLHTLGFVSSISNSSLFIRKSKEDYTILLMYIDGVLVTGNNLVAIQKLFKELDMQFSIKDLGSLTYFLGVQVVDTRGGFILHQRKYINEILQRAGMKGAKGLAILISTQ